MADNIATLVARLIADSTGFKAGLDSAQRDLTTFRARAQATSREASQSFRGIAVAWTAMAGTIASVGVALGFGSLINDAKEFEAQLKVIQATAQASDAQMSRLTSTIRRVGLDFKVGARAASQAAQELQKNGVALKDINEGALESAVTLAQALGGNFADAAQIAATTLQVFREDASRLDDIIQGITGTVLGGKFELSDYALALQQGGGAAKAAGIELEDFNAALLLIQRNIGSTGSDTGTALRVFVSRLVPASNEAREAMTRLSLSFYDARGNFVGLEEAAGRIQRAFKGLTDEARNRDMYTIFGVDAARVATALYNEGAAGLARYRTEVESAADAAGIAEARTEGFAGALKRLRAEWENLAIVIGQNPALEAGTNWLADRVGGVALGAEFAQHGGFRQPAFGALTDEGRRRFEALSADERRGVRRQMGRDSFGESMSGWDYYSYGINSMRPAELMRFLETQTGFDPSGGQASEAPLSETYLGRLLWEAAQKRHNQQADDLSRRLFSGRPAWSGTATPFAPPPLATLPTVAPPLSAADLEKLDRQRDDDIAFDEWLKNIQENVGAWAKDQQIEVGKLDVEFEGFRTKQNEIKEAADGFANEVGSTLRDAFVNWEWDFDSVADRIMTAWRAALFDVFIGDDMQKYMRFLAEQVKGLLNSMLGSGSGKGSSSGGWLSMAVDWIGKAFAGGFDEGGYIPPGQWGMTGEAGPEPVFGGRAGVTVFPGDGAGGGTVVHQNFTIDARGAQRGVGAEIEMAIQRAKGEAVAAAVTQVGKIQRARRTY